jgi:rod shape-determining protein MreC
MTRYTRSMTDVAAASPRGWVQRAITIVVFLGCAVLLIIGAGDNPRIRPLKQGLMDATAPLMRVAAEPAAVWRNATGWVGEISHLRIENARLRAENDALKRWQAVAVSLKAENEELKRALGYRPIEETAYVTARVIGFAMTGAGHSMMLDQGFEDGVRPHQAVISADGLLGKVSDVSAHAARVLLLTDMNARVPVMGEESRERAVMAGTGAAMARLKYVPEDSGLKVGERLVTTADGGVVPAGIPVGHVFSRSEGDVRVRAVAEARKAEYVRVVSHDTPLGAAPDLPK